MKNKVPHSDNKLLQEMQADNMLAFDTLYKRYHKRLFHFANSILKSKEDAENIVQEVFVRLWENRHKIEKVRPYLFRVAYNTTI
ncbi:MAG: RNA polymerase sigma factor, partial [Bacteroidota bacterium]